MSEDLAGSALQLLGSRRRCRPDVYNANSLIISENSPHGSDSMRGAWSDSYGQQVKGADHRVSSESGRFALWRRMDWSDEVAELSPRSHHARCSDSCSGWLDTLHTTLSRDGGYRSKCPRADHHCGSGQPHLRISNTPSQNGVKGK